MTGEKQNSFPSQSFSYFVRGNDPSTKEDRAYIVRWELICKRSEIIYRVDLVCQMIQTNCILGSEGSSQSDVYVSVANTFRGLGEMEGTLQNWRQKTTFWFLINGRQSSLSVLQIVELEVILEKRSTELQVFKFWFSIPYGFPCPRVLNRNPKSSSARKRGCGEEKYRERLSMVD